MLASGDTHLVVAICLVCVSALVDESATILLKLLV